MKYFDKYLADFDKIYIYLRVFRVKEFEFGVIFMTGGLPENTNPNCVEYYQNLTCQIKVLTLRWWKIFGYTHTTTLPLLKEVFEDSNMTWSIWRLECDLYQQKIVILMFHQVYLMYKRHFIPQSHNYRYT